MKIIKSNPEIFLNQKKQIADFKNSLDNDKLKETNEDVDLFVFEILDFLESFSSNMEMQMQYLFLEFEALVNNDIIEINTKIEIDELFFMFYENFIQEYFVQYTPELENTLDFGGALNYCKFKKEVLLENIPYRLWVIEKKEILEL